MENKTNILMQRYDFGRLLGQGTFAKVYYGRNLATGQSVAIKVIDKEKILKVGLIDQTKREISVMGLVKQIQIQGQILSRKETNKVRIEMQRKNEGEGEAKSKVSVIETWLRKHRLEYVGATRHPFIHSIRDGTVDLSSFKRWLEQDYIFVRAFVPFVASVLLKAWKESFDSTDVEVILGGMASLNDEIAWFKKEASKWGVSLNDVVPQETNLDYCRFLESLMSSEVEYTLAITAFWAMETVYQDSFAHCLEDGSEMPEELKETCQRWGNDDFGQYCRALQSIAERRLEKAPDEVRKKAEVAVLEVLEHEVAFWNMSHGNT